MFLTKYTRVTEGLLTIISFGKILYIMSSTTRLTIGTIIGFISGLGLIGIHPTDTSFLTENIDSVIGGVLACISLIGFIEHHIHPKAGTSSTTVTAKTETVAPEVVPTNG